jgi:hypothetical protein
MKAAVQAIRENPSWAKQPPHWMRVALWAHRYTEEVPSRNDIAKALVSSRGLATTAGMGAITAASMPSSIAAL